MTHLILSQDGNAGVMTLNRPEALNALSIAMVRQMSEALDKWRDDEAIKLVIIRSSSARAFCAGGDVREAVSLIKEASDNGARAYFTAEYGFDRRLATFPKPVVALVDGVVMGGGFGVARLADYMVVSSHIKMAMPETAIGLFPDVGASYFLRRAPFAVALMMGMTGTMIGAGDACAWHLADIHCEADRFDALASALSQAESDDEVRAALSTYESAPPPAEMAHKLGLIEDIFNQDSLQNICDAAHRAQEDSHGAKWATALEERCPSSIGAFWYMMRHLDVPQTAAQAIERDFFLACKMTARPDFVEGVRAVLLDKDNQPHWSPRAISEVTDEVLADLFDFAGITPLPE